MIMTTYKNYKGIPIDIQTLTDKQIIKLYEFFKQYCNIIKTTCLKQVGKPNDIQYADYTRELISVKEALRNEIKSRKLIISHFQK